MTFAGWLLANIVLPMALPLLGMLAVLAALRKLAPPPQGLHIMAVVKDGQLCWAVIGMAVASLYEVLEAYRTRQAVPGWSTLGILVLLCLTWPAMVLAANGAVFPTPILRGSPFAGFRPLRRWLVHYENFVASAVMALAAAILYSCLHYQIAVAR